MSKKESVCENSLNDLADNYRSTAKVLAETIADDRKNLAESRRKGKSRQCAKIYRKIEIERQEYNECMEIAAHLKHYYDRNERGRRKK